ncbi:MAG: hypothetical protein JSV62_06935 [Promethearchaeota archaeon]|nr:MAG: hypothetical protein JSV62_06935 [Candidatus Lokiarchaeota archaeon]
MLFYSITENGALRKVSKVDFNENKVFLIDDLKTLYLWFGTKASKKKRELSIKRTEKLKDEKEKPTEIKLIGQNQEYGSFLAIMDILKKGFGTDDSFERRAELDSIDIEDTIELIEAGIDPDFEAEITLVAHKLSQENPSYEDLCRKLATIQLDFLKGKGKASEKEINKKYEEIYKSSSTHTELLWLISELSILLEKKL